MESVVNENKICWNINFVQNNECLEIKSFTINSKQFNLQVTK